MVSIAVQQLDANCVNNTVPNLHLYRGSKVCRVLMHPAHLELSRTFSNHIIADIARRVESLHMCSEWFDCTEPSLNRGSKVCRVLMHPAHLELSRTFSNHIIADIARRVESLHMCSEWFDDAEPSLTTFSSCGPPSLSGNTLFDTHQR